MIRKSKVILPINNLNYGVTLPSLSQRNWVRRRGALSCVGSRDSYRNTLPAVKLCSPNCSQHEHQNFLLSLAKLEYCLQCIITDNGPVPQNDSCKHSQEDIRTQAFRRNRMLAPMDSVSTEIIQQNKNGIQSGKTLLDFKYFVHGDNEDLQSQKRPKNKIVNHF